jgi:hypothetical protein
MTDVECNSCGLFVNVTVVRDLLQQSPDSRFTDCPFCAGVGFSESDIEDSENSSLTCLKGSSSHRGVSEIESKKRDIRRELKFKLINNGYSTAAGSMDACGNATIDIECNDCGHMTQVDHHCDNRVCGKCGSSRWSRTVKSLKKRIFDNMDWHEVRFMTLTVENTDELTSADVSDLRDAFSKLKRREFFDKRIRGGVYSIECNYTDSWNLHMHVVYEGSYIPQDRLSEAWSDLTGSPIVDIRRSNDKDSDAEELAKYITKQPDVSSNNSEIIDEDSEVLADRLMQYHRAMYQTNLVQSFGVFHHSSDRAVSSRWANALYECPECGSEDISVCVPPAKSIAYNLKPSDPDSDSSLINLQDYNSVSM